MFTGASPPKPTSPAAALGGATVLVAAGTYAETLVLGSDHDGVRLRARCAELAPLLEQLNPDAIERAELLHQMLAESPFGVTSAALLRATESFDFELASATLRQLESELP
jgi:hypothetical protein